MCDISVVNRGSAINARASLFLLLRRGERQVVPSTGAIRFSNAENFSGFLWNGGDTLVVSKKGVYKIEFLLSYLTSLVPMQVGLTINHMLQPGTYGVDTNITAGISQLSGMFTLKLNAGDAIRLVNTRSIPLTIVSTGFGIQPERSASLNVIELRIS